MTANRVVLFKSSLAEFRSSDLQRPLPRIDGNLRFQIRLFAPYERPCPAPAKRSMGFAVQRRQVVTSRDNPLERLLAPNATTRARG